MGQPLLQDDLAFRPPLLWPPAPMLAPRSWLAWRGVPCAVTLAHGRRSNRLPRRSHGAARGCHRRHPSAICIAWGGICRDHNEPSTCLRPSLGSATEDDLHLPSMVASCSLYALQAGISRYVNLSPCGMVDRPSHFHPRNLTTLPSVSTALEQTQWGSNAGNPGFGERIQ